MRYTIPGTGVTVVIGEGSVQMLFFLILALFLIT